MKKYTLITGASSGIGYALAQEFAKKKHNLIIASRNSKKMAQLKNVFEKKYHIEVNPCTLDLSVTGAAEKLFRFCQNNHYSVDLLVNNAGIGIGARPHVDQCLEDIRKLLNVNLNSVTELCKLFGAEMKKNKAGYILNVSSSAAFQPMPFSAIYGASKSFVLLLSEAMHIELAPYNIGVTAVCPGITDTNFFLNGKPNISKFVYNLISPELVAQRAVKALYKRKLYVIPYFQHWLIAQASRFFTRNFIAQLMVQIEQKRKRYNIDF